MFDQQNLARAVALAPDLAIGAGIGAGVDDVAAQRLDHVSVEALGERVEFDRVGDHFESVRRQHFGHDRHDALHQRVTICEVGRPIEIGQEKTRGVAIIRAREKIGVRAGKPVRLPLSKFGAGCRGAVGRLCARPQSGGGFDIRRQTAQDIMLFRHGKLSFSGPAP